LIKRTSILKDIYVFRVKPSRCAFVNTVLIIQPNTTIQFWYIIPLVYTATCFGCPDQPSSGRCRIHKKNTKEERRPFTVLWIITILFRRWLMITLKWNTGDVLLVFKPACLKINGTPLLSPLSKSCLPVVNKGTFMNVLEKCCFYQKTYNNIQLNGKSTFIFNRTFETTHIHKNSS
jgi:hypothetical protein